MCSAKSHLSPSVSRPGRDDFVSSLGASGRAKHREVQSPLSVNRYGSYRFY